MNIPFLRYFDLFIVFLFMCGFTHILCMLLWGQSLNFGGAIAAALAVWFTRDKTAWT